MFARLLPCTTRVTPASSFLRLPPHFRFSTSRTLARRPQYEYQSFGGARSRGTPPLLAALRAWRQRPTFAYEAGGLSLAVGGAYAYNLERVPVSGRLRFNVVSDAQEAATADELYRQTVREFGHRVLPPNDPRAALVQRVVDRLLPHSGLDVGEGAGGGSWTVTVVDEPEERNAFVIPGGHVFVFTGILPICGGEAGVAAVIGHEIAHNVAHHAAERMSQGLLVALATWLINVFVGPSDGWANVLFDYGFMRPGSRKQESEADYIGLMMMAESCYDPNAAVAMQTRLAQAAEHSIPQFLSTHPMGEHRVAQLRDWLPKALETYNNSECGPTADMMGRFQGLRFT